MNAPIVTVYTNDKNLWLLNGFQHLFKKYWSPTQNVRIVGYAAPKNGTLSSPFSFVSIAKRNYPVSEWSTGLIKSLDHFIGRGEEFMVMLFEDYWLTKPVDLVTIRFLTEYIQAQPRNILRIDLTTDRCQHGRFLTLYEQVKNGCKLFRTAAHSPYQMSFQAAIWNIKLLREVLRPHENPWQSELAGSKRLAAAGNRYVVLGTKDHPVKYQPVYRSNRGTMDISKLSEEDQETILKRGWI